MARNLSVRLGAPAPAPAVAPASDSFSAFSPQVSCPAHLTLADLPVAHALGSLAHHQLLPTADPPLRILNLGRKVSRKAGDKVHFCPRCDFPIAQYGRLDPCQHIFCLTCARKGYDCYLCNERILRIQRLRALEGVFICGVSYCLISFLKKEEFISHIKNSHYDLWEKEENNFKNASSKPPDSSSHGYQENQEYSEVKTSMEPPVRMNADGQLRSNPPLHPVEYGQKMVMMIGFGQSMGPIMNRSLQQVPEMSMGPLLVVPQPLRLPPMPPPPQNLHIQPPQKRVRFSGNTVYSYPAPTYPGHGTPIAHNPPHPPNINEEWQGP